ncbi:MAG: PD-(D/E)XK nuclease family protein [Phycisphaerales bacterium]|nr:PD-(D/E)XK nuclease family protein [Phycisphaerales bacterium]
MTQAAPHHEASQVTEQRCAGAARDLLTSTRLATLRRCAKQHYLRYELGLSRVRTSDALRLGAAFHRGLERYNRGADPADAIVDAVAEYEFVPDWADSFEWDVEREIIQQLLAGHFWRYEKDDVEIIAVERTFELPLVNPQSGRPSRAFVIAGKIDAIVRLADGRLAVLEYKTAGEDIAPDSDYWPRLRCDPQISQYVLAARALGFDVATVLYDVTRKPTISPLRATPLDKRKYTKDGRLYAAQRENDETPEEFGQRLLVDVGDRPDYYFQRREVPRLEDELAEFQAEVWQQAKQLLDARRHGRWFRNVHRFTCGTCEFANICLNGVRVTSGTAPAGFQILTNVSPELPAGDD